MNTTPTKSFSRERHQFLTKKLGIVDGSIDRLRWEISVGVRVMK